MSSLPEKFLGKKVFAYELVECLGEGELGAVFRGVQDERSVAIRVLPESFSSATGLIDKIVDEARRLGALRHPHLLHIYKIFQADHHLCLTMRFAEGGSLEERLAAEGQVGAARAVAWIEQIARGLDAAAGLGIHHGDLHPGNIFFTKTGRVQIANFGLAAPTKISATRTLLGRPRYMSPERCRDDRPADELSDLYSTGCVLYELLNGRPPFTDDAPGDVMVKHVFEAPPQLEYTDIPLTLVDVLARLLKKDPAERMASAAELVAALEGLKTHSDTSPLPPLLKSGGKPGIAFNDSSLHLDVSEAAALRRDDLPALRLPGEPKIDDSEARADLVPLAPAPADAPTEPETEPTVAPADPAAGLVDDESWDESWDDESWEESAEASDDAAVEETAADPAAPEEAASRSGEAAGDASSSSSAAVTRPSGPRRRSRRKRRDAPQPSRGLPAWAIAVGVAVLLGVVVLVGVWLLP